VVVGVAAADGVEGVDVSSTGRCFPPSRPQDVTTTTTDTTKRRLTLVAIADHRRLRVN